MSYLQDLAFSQIPLLAEYSHAAYPAFENLSTNAGEVVRESTVSIKHDPNKLQMLGLLSINFAGLLYDFSSTNELVLANIAASTFSENGGVFSIGKSALATGAFAFAEQTTVGLAMIATMNRLPEIGKSINKHFFKATPENSNSIKRLNLFDKYLLASTLSTAAVVVRETVVNSDISERDQTRSLLATSALVGSGVSAVTALTLATTEATGTTDTLIEAVRSPLLLAGLLGVRFGIPKIKKIFKKQ